MLNQHILFVGDNDTTANARAHIVLAPPKVEPLHDVFAEAMLEDTSAHQHRSPLDWVAAIGVHFAILAVLLILPLYFTAGLDSHKLNLTFLATPMMPAGPPPPPMASAAARPAHVAPVRVFNPGKLTAPTFIPKAIVEYSCRPLGRPPDEALMGVPGGVPGGIPGGQVGGVLGGVLGGALKGVPPPAPVASRAESARPRGWRCEAAAPALWARTGLSVPCPASPPLGCCCNRSNHRRTRQRKRHAGGQRTSLADSGSD